MEGAHHAKCYCIFVIKLHIASKHLGIFYIEMEETTKFTSHMCVVSFKAIFYIEMDETTKVYITHVSWALRPYFYIEMDMKALTQRSIKALTQTSINLNTKEVTRW